MKLSAAVLFSALAAAVSAITPPNYEEFPEPLGNPIFTPGLNELIPVGEPYPITWNPTTEGKVSLQLLRGPSTNVVPIGIIAENIQNIGSYVWTPDVELEPDTTGYGIMIIAEGSGQYQYSTQFGIENDKFTPPDEDSEPADTDEPTETATASATVSASSSSASEPATTSSVSLPPVPTHSVPIRTYTTTYCDCEDENEDAAPTEVPAPPPVDIIPTISTTYIAVPTQSAEVPSDPSPPDFDSAAGRNSVSLLGGAAIAMAAILAF